jgi:hypothetical protein
MDINTSAGGELQSLIQLLQTPFGITVLVLLFLASIAAIVMPRMRWVLLALLFWTGMFGYSGADFQPYNILMYPLDQIRVYSRTLVAGLTLTLIIPSLISGRGWRMRLISPVAVLFLVFQLLFCVREIFAGDTVRGPTAIVVFSITFVVLCIGLPRWLQSMDDVHNAIRSLAWAAGLFCICTLAQTLENRNAILMAGRMIGTTGNPQTAALILGSGLAPLCYMVARRSEAFYERILYGALAALNALFLVWTGSRTGVIIALIGLIVTFRYRLHRLFIVGLCSAAFFLILLNIFADSTVINQHIWSFDDTRSPVWMSQLDQYLRNPLMGTLTEGQGWGYGENSYLAAAARYGTLGILPLLAAVAVCVIGILQLNGNKRYLRQDALLVDLISGCLLAVGIGAWFEGYLLASFSFPTYCLLIYLALMNALRDIATANYNHVLELAQSGEAPVYLSEGEPAYAE